MNDHLLNKRPKKGKSSKFEQNDKKRQTVDDLIKKLTTRPDLALPSPECQIVIETGA